MLASTRARTISGKNISRKSKKWEKIKDVKKTRSKETHCVWASNDRPSQSSISHQFFLCSSCIPRVGEQILLATHFILLTTYEYEQTKENLTSEWIKFTKINRSDHIISWLAIGAKHFTIKKNPFSFDDEEITDVKSRNDCKSAVRDNHSTSQNAQKRMKERKSNTQRHINRSQKYYINNVSNSTENSLILLYRFDARNKFDKSTVPIKCLFELFKSRCREASCVGENI